MMRTKENKADLIGKTIIIKDINVDTEPNPELTKERYLNKTGVVEKIDDAGNLWGTWGGISIIPDVDTYAILEKSKILKDYVWEKYPDGSGSLKNEKGERMLSYDLSSSEVRFKGDSWEELPDVKDKFDLMEKMVAQSLKKDNIEKREAVENEKNIKDETDPENDNWDNDIE